MSDLDFFTMPIEPVEQDDPIVENRENQEIRYEELLQTLEVFKKRGWKHVASRLQEHIDASTQILLSGHITSMDEVTKHRERIAAFQLLLNMPESARQEADRIASQLTE